MLEDDVHCAFQYGAGAGGAVPCKVAAEFEIWNDGIQTPSCKEHIGDLLGPGENRITPFHEGSG